MRLLKTTQTIVLFFLMYAVAFGPCFDVIPEKTKALEEGPNLILNPGFETNGSGLPSDWTDQWDKGDGTKTIDSSEKHSGETSWRFTQNDETGYLGAYSGFDSPDDPNDGFISVEYGALYNLSAWVKSRKGTEKVFIGWDVFDKDKKRVVTGKKDADDKDILVARNFFALKDKTVSKQWQQVQNTQLIDNGNIKYVRIILLGPNLTNGDVWWDDISLSKVGSSPSQYGCINDASARCLDIGSSSDLSGDINVTSLDKDSVVSSSPSLGEIKTDGDISYRELQSKVGIQVEIPQFGAINDSFPDKPMMMEIRYKDTINDFLATTSSNRYDRASVFSKINFEDLDALSQPFERVGSLGSYNDGLWKVVQIPFPKTQWQRIRSIDGKFTFKINMPTKYAPDPNLILPIDYISLHVITDQQIETHNDWLRQRRGLRKVEFTPTGIVPDIPNSFAWYTTSTMQPVYPSNVPTHNSINKPLSLTGTLDEIETSSFSIYAKNSLSNLSFVINDLIDKDGQKISKENISIKKVVYDYKYWTTDRLAGSTYGLMPDRVENFSSINLDSNQSQQFYLYVKVPDFVNAGQYLANIDILFDGEKVDAIPFDLTVLPIKLLDSQQVNLVWHNPYSKVYSLDKEKVFKDMKDHGAEAISRFESLKNNIECEGGNSTCESSSINVDYTRFETELEYSIGQGVIKKQAFYLDYSAISDRIISLLGLSGSTWEKLTNPQFQTQFKKITQEVMRIGNDHGVEIIFQAIDEPSNNLRSREVSDRLNRMIKDEGGKTWVTYDDDGTTDEEVACSECSPCEECIIKEGVPYLPSLAGITDYKVWSHMANESNDNSSSYGYYTTYYSQTRNPIYNRFLHGLFANKTNAKVVASYAYGDMIGDPYNDFDSAYYNIYPNSPYDYLLAYPTWTGEMIDTVAWEGEREGIKDAKYIATLKDLIQKNPNSSTSIEAQRYLDSVVSGISADWINDYVDKGNEFGFADQIIKSVAKSDNLDYESFDSIRKKIFGYINDLITPLVVTADKIQIKKGEKPMYKELTYNVSFKNLDQGNINDVNITDQIPTKTTYIDGSATAGGQLFEGVLKWHIDTLGPGEIFTASFKVKVN